MRKISSEQFIQYLRSLKFQYDSGYGSAGRYIVKQNGNFIYVVVRKDNSILVCCNNSDWIFEGGHESDALQYIRHNLRFLSTGNFDTDGENYVTATDQRVEQQDKQDNSEAERSNIDNSTLKRFITLIKRLNKQLFFKDNSGNIKRVAPSKYDAITPEQLSTVFVTKTGKEEMSLAIVIPQLKQDNLIEEIEKLYQRNNGTSKLVEDRYDDVFDWNGYTI